MWISGKELIKIKENVDSTNSKDPYNSVSVLSPIPKEIEITDEDCSSSGIQKTELYISLSPGRYFCDKVIDYYVFLLTKNTPYRFISTIIIKAISTFKEKSIWSKSHLINLPKKF
jgi:hypothetical protein